MNITHRPYSGIRDFIQMKSILAIGRKTDPKSHYVHIGDLCWWMFFTDRNDAHWQDHICLWEQDGDIIGWTLLDPTWRSFDVYLLPRMRGTAEDNQILDWSIERLMEIVLLNSGTEIQTMWVAEHDTEHILQLELRGFERGEYAMWYLEYPLDDCIPDPQLPNGFTVRFVTGEMDVKLRAIASHGAFASKKPFQEYWPRYKRFVDSPVYGPSLDLVTVAPEGNFASFCIAWPDPVNHIGLFEPVGTHPDYQSLGLGKAVITEGLHQLRSYGMNRASVCVEVDNLTANNLYEAVGFQKQYQLCTYVKTIA